MEARMRKKDDHPIQKLQYKYKSGFISSIRPDTYSKFIKDALEIYETQQSIHRFSFRVAVDYYFPVLPRDIITFLP